MNLALYFLMILVFISYVSFIWNKYGILPSISQSYYELPPKWKWLFPIFCWGFAFPAMVIAGSPLMLFAGGGIVFVGAAAAFQEKMTKEFHIIGALMGVILSQVAIVLDYGLWPISLAFVLLSIPMLLLEDKFSNRIWWIELMAFLSISVVLGLNL